MIWAFLLLVANLLAEEGPTPIAHFEGALPSVAGGCVHVLTGAPLISETDLVLPGVEPLSFNRRCHYAPKMAVSKVGKSWDFTLLQTLQRTFEEGTSPYRPYYPTTESEDYLLEEDSQAMFLFCYPKGKGEKAYFYSRGKGMTNLAHGYPSAKSALKNAYLTREQVLMDPIEAEIVFGNGERKRFIKGVPKEAGDATLVLKEIIVPNGFKKKLNLQMLGL